MTSTVTTTAISMLNNAAVGGSLAVIGMLILVALLVQKELVSTSHDRRLRQLSRVMNVGILPLMLAFVLIVFFKIVQALG
jgi:TRAP-type C4-dicarboxylate transport system permease large subunit